ncbi:MAG: hypothetical protein KC464_27585, partial [Myxococcales bacterium]|nr:hypothetical protein [Myxococcales bacterium]
MNEAPAAGRRVRLCVLGPSGRMGAAVIDAADADPAVVVAAAVDRQGAAVLGSAVAADVIASDDLSHGLAAADVYV